LRVLILHNHYSQPGGEDVVVRSEAEMLRARGIQVFEYNVEQKATRGEPVSRLVHLARSATWSKASYEGIRNLCERIRPDVAHVHNFWMKLSPSAHGACHDAGVATVQTLHNFRLLCTNALLLRDGKPCEDCIGRLPWRGVVRSCYRNSFLASSAVAGMVVVNRTRGTWDKDVDAFIALSEHSRSKFIAGKLPAGKIFVKPNFIEDPGGRVSPPSASNLVIYAGRLSSEKGLTVLLSAWAGAGLSSSARLMIMGDGPERMSLEKQAAGLGLSAPQVIFAGAKSYSEVIETVGQARAVVLPSLCFENFPTIITEAFSVGRPVIVSHVGALKEIVDEGTTGLTFPPGDDTMLGRTLGRIVNDDVLADELGRNARMQYLAKYTPERNYEMLMRVYRFAIEQAHRTLPECLRDFKSAKPHNVLSESTHG
jgi:glycosyltransferase involved in cell wall biosynthesis